MPHSSQNETNSNEVPQEGSKMLYGIGYTKMLWFVKYMVESKNKINKFYVRKLNANCRFKSCIQGDIIHPAGP